jgi:hypothetical protein
MWRPQNWGNPPLFVLKAKPVEAYEAGADAMLKAVTEWVRSQEELEMMDDPENFNYFCVRAKDLAELEVENG